jgi:REP element-mobilizing transposase RayT
MTRLARVVIPGHPHHVTQRGNGRARTFFGDGDYELYRDLLAENCRSAGVEVWAWCLMPNHVHLILVPSDDAPFKFIIRPFTTVGMESRNFASWFEHEIFSAIRDLEFESPITGIAIFPTIFDREISHPPDDYLTYKKTKGQCLLA